MSGTGNNIVFRVGFALGVLLIAVAGVVAWARWPQSVDRGTIPKAAAPDRITGSPVVGATASPRTTGRISPGQRRPLSLHIPSLGIDAPIVPVSVGRDGALGVPQDPHQLGWWSGGPAPGDPQGTSVIDGHVDWAGVGPGALFHLRSVEVGAPVIVERAGERTRFQVVALREYDKAQLPWRQIFDQSVAGRLVIVTCGGSFNEQTHNYADNIVAYAVPVDT